MLLGTAADETDGVMTDSRRRAPLDLYLDLLAAMPGDGEAARVRALRRLLAGPRGAWPATLRECIDATGVSTGYLTRGLLSIHRFVAEVRAALESGLPFAVARRVNGLASPAARRRALAPLAELGERPRGRMLPREVSAQVERLARAEAASASAGQGGVGLDADGTGWLPAMAKAAAPRGMRGDVWSFEPTVGGLAKDEPLAERVVEALLARTIPNGGDMVDVTAGRGTFAWVGRRHGVRSWSGDLAPGAPFVHRSDARSLLVDRPPGIAPACADLLVVHPPTYPIWARTAADAPGGMPAYQDALEQMLAGPLGVVRPGGFVVMVTRPVRERGAVSVATSYLADAMALSGVTLEAYVLAVSVAASEDWHLLVGRATG